MNSHYQILNFTSSLCRTRSIGSHFFRTMFEWWNAVASGVMWPLDCGSQSASQVWGNPSQQCVIKQCRQTCWKSPVNLILSSPRLMLQQQASQNWLESTEQQSGQDHWLHTKLSPWEIKHSRNSNNKCIISMLYAQINTKRSQSASILVRPNWCCSQLYFTELDILDQIVTYSVNFRYPNIWQVKLQQVTPRN